MDIKEIKNGAVSISRLTQEKKKETTQAEFQKALQEYATRRGYDAVITAPDTDLSKESEDSDSPVAVQNEILLRHVQFIGPACDISRDIVDLMNAYYQRSKARGNPKDL